MKKLIVGSILVFLLVSCETTRIADPGIRCPQPPAELLQRPQSLKEVSDESK